MSNNGENICQLSKLIIVHAISWKLKSSIHCLALEVFVTLQEIVMLQLGAVPDKNLHFSMNPFVNILAVLLITYSNTSPICKQ